MPTDEPDPRPRRSPAALARRRIVVEAGHAGDEAAARAGLDDDDPAVRASAVGALVRMAALRDEDLRRAGSDPDPDVRRRAATAIATLAAAGSADPVDPAPTQAPAGTSVSASACGAMLTALLRDTDARVVEVGAWATGEWVGAAREGERRVPEGDLVMQLEDIATGHEDALCREAAVAALGAIGDERSLAAILHATTDRATVRRRAVIALAPYEGPDVHAALSRARADRDWQVRQAAEDLLAVDGDAGDPAMEDP